ncbi:MAG: hypothetical protein ACOC1P_05430 [Minisyncoccales bacterium]
MKNSQSSALMKNNSQSSALMKNSQSSALMKIYLNFVKITYSSSEMMINWK